MTCKDLIFSVSFVAFFLTCEYEVNLDDGSLSFSSNSAGIVVGPIAALILIIGNVGVILGLFPAHVAWTLYTLLK